ncbi:hypothetical protein [Fibrobacter sp. UWH1]|uniref:hypothetical protein n=1 Tax=Fibrobacter sp. UWH1 TaxID=1964354 RepID=UPI000B524444|nr:hypothetical protein [Fibrobacter sp. UWH1]OWV09774.1 hypothetical protein B7992_11950 [Fibrobacter sp. UWH1]
MLKPKLRDSHKLDYSEDYPLNEIPESVVTKIGGYMIYLLHIGRKDVSGTDWGDAFAQAIGGTHLDSPLGIADVVKNKVAWSMKTVKCLRNPFDCTSVRLISGRCSPDYSYGITDPHKDVQATGRAVLNIWNERVNIAQDEYSQIRTSVLIRSEDLLSYTLYETENHRFIPSNYKWSVNKNGNLIGTEIATNRDVFTWQPHGSQFTISEKVPSSAVKFKVKQPSVISYSDVLERIYFDENWVTIVNGR